MKRAAPAAADLQSRPDFRATTHIPQIRRRTFPVNKNTPYDRTVFQSMTMILQFGINMIVPIAMMTFFGIWLDRKLGTVYLTIIFFFIGAIAGGQNIYRMAKKIFSTPDTNRKRVTEEMERLSKEAMTESNQQKGHTH